MNIIEHTLLYLRESLANYTENEFGKEIYDKIETENYHDEAAFIKDLNDKEMAYLESVLQREIDYAKSAQDTVRLRQLHEVSELIL